MKPVLLEFSGLNSYKDVQTIAFDSFCESGLFGIFGPTGSGKSTVLDAITLALYGRVERSLQRRGILNQDTDKLMVSFSFSLGAELYRVERSYVRNQKDPWAVRNTVSRLTQVNDKDWDVIADKDGDVNETIQTLLGLSHEDFSRAVVLPQGKFAEFLSLRGSERRQMLQRIFSLEQYGDQLNEKVKEQETQIRSQLRDLETQLQTLGDASPEAVKQAQSDVDAGKRRLQETVSAYDSQEKALAEARRLRELQSKLEAVQGKQQSLASDEESINNTKKRLQRAESAEPYRETLSEQQSMVQQVQELEVRQTALQGQLAGVVEALQAATEHRETVEKKRTQEMPELLERRESLRQAKTWEEELTTGRSALKDVVVQERAASAEAERCGREVARLESEQEKLTDHRDTLRRRRQDLWMPAPQRQQLESAAAAARSVLEQQKSLKQWQDREEALRVERERLRTEREAFLQRREALESESERLQAVRSALDASQLDTEEGEVQRRWLSAFKDLVQRGKLIDERLQDVKQRQTRCQAKAAEAERMCEQAETAWRTSVQQCQEAEAVLKNLETANRAAVLAAELRPTEPCPVCGSLEHPRLALPPDTTWDVAEANALSKRASEREAHDELQTWSERQRQATVEQDGIEQELAKVSELFEAWRAELPEALRLQSLPDLERSLNAEERELGQYLERLRDWTERDQTWRSQSRAFDDELQQLNDQSASVNEEWNTNAARLETAQETLNTVQEAYDAAISKLGQFSDQEPQAVLESYKRYLERQNQLDHVDEELSEIEKRLEALQAQVSKCQDEARTKQRLRDQLNQQREQDEKGVHELEARLHRRITPFDTVESAMDHVVQRLQQLEQTVNAAVTRQETLREEREQAAGDLRALESQLEIFSDRCTTLDAKLKHALNQLQMDTAQELAAALIDASERSLWQQQIQEHEQKAHYLDEEFRTLTAELGGQSLSDEDWRHCQLQLQEAREHRDEAISRLGALQQGLHDLQERGVRWKQCRADEKHLEKEFDTLIELRALLRGNAFVEYLAERQLHLTAQNASQHLGRLTKYRYALEVDAGSGFVMRDDANGGQRRPVHSLSGGETFLTSLALALALSGQIQLRGRYPLEFFFLDEGFGSLDEELLELVIAALERMDTGNMLIGVITHVPELKERIAQKIVVTPASPGGPGSSLQMAIG